MAETNEAASTPPNESAAIQIIGGHYQIVRQLAAGGFGQTFVAKDLHLPGQPLCVVKQLKAQFSNPALLKTAQRLFDQEAKTLYTLGEHPQIPRLLAHFEEKQEFYLVQELVDGQPLSERMILGQRWPEAKAIALTQDILQVLSFVHTKRVIHRDIKPANLLWRESDGRVVLIDFGAVKAVQQVSTVVATLPAEGHRYTPVPSSTIAIGTPGYMPIEQQSGKPRFSSDVYAVGLIAIQVLTGLSPTQLARNEDTEEIEWRSHAPQVSNAFADLIDKMVRYDFRSRFTNAEKALSALQALPSQTLASVPTVAYLSSKYLSNKALSNEASPTATNQLEPKTALQTEQSASKRDYLHDTSANKPLKRISTPALLQNKLSQGIFVVIAVTGAIVSVLVWQTLTPDLQTPDLQTADTPVEARADSVSSTSQSDSNSAATAPQAALDLAKKADEQFANGDYPQAITLYNQATRLGLDTTETQWNHCNQLAEQGQTETALEVCGLVAGANHNDSDDIIIAGAHLAQAGEYARALTVLTQVERVRPDNLSIPWPKAIALNGLGQYEAALSMAETGLARTQGLDLPNVDALLLVEKGNALVGLDQPEEALSLATEALILFPDLPMALELTEKAQLAMP